VNGYIGMVSYTRELENRLKTCCVQRLGFAEHEGSWGSWKLQEPPGSTITAAKRHIRLADWWFGCYVWWRN